MIVLTKEKISVYMASICARCLMYIDAICNGRFFTGRDTLYHIRTAELNMQEKVMLLAPDRYQMYQQCQNSPNSSSNYYTCFNLNDYKAIADIYPYAWYNLVSGLFYKTLAKQNSNIPLDL